jgi:5-oxopent-3-ene-1,2,5-tricarboxylate decarboxylase/2-hydroxyhepta-2,4-diene-1,7-dioate isomerase
MRRARIRLGEEILAVTVDDDDILIAPDGRRLAPERVEWLAPPHRTIFALGLNYAAHVAELTFKPPPEPLVFLKTASTVTGHRQPVCRPDGVEFMHYEAELVAVIGRTAHRVNRAQAMHFVGGYTVCNDFAVRDYLENYYRPNLRVKCRDSLTPLGPWVVDAADIPDPGDLAVRTWVNGELRQRGSTGDMIFDIPYLIEYLSAFMTLAPGDMISTGTPEGVSDVRPGDVVEVEVEGVGRLENPIVSEAEYYGA